VTDMIWDMIEMSIDSVCLFISVPNMMYQSIIRFVLLLVSLVWLRVCIVR